MRSIFTFLFFFILLYTQAQKKNTDLLAADTLFEYGEYARSITSYEKASVSFQSSSMQDYLYCKTKSADCYIRIGKLEEAETLLQESLLKCPAGMITEEAMLHNSMANVYMYKGKLDDARREAMTAISLVKVQKIANQSVLAECYNTLGLIEWLSGSEENSLEYLNQALVIRQKLYGENHPAVAAMYNNIGLVKSGSDTEGALQEYEKALEIYKKTYKDNHPSLAIAYSNLGHIYRRQGVLNTSISNYEKALNIWNRLYTGSHPNKAFVYSSMAQVYSDEKKYTEAIEYANKALAIYLEFYSNKHPNTAACYTLLGSIYAEQGSFDPALTNFQKSFISNCEHFNNTDYRINPAVDDYFDGQLLLSTLTQKAVLLEKRHVEKSLRIKDLTLAISCYQSCDTLIDEQRHVRTSKNDKIALGKYSSEVSENAVSICYALAHATARKNHYESLAFYFIEKNKAMVLQEAIADTKAKSFAGIPADELQKEEALKATVSYLEQKLSQGLPDEEMKPVQARLFEAKRSYEQFIQYLEKTYPAYYNLKYNTRPVSIEELQQAMAEGDCMLEYLVSDAKEKIFLMKIEKNRYELIQLDKHAVYEKYISGLRNAIRFDIKKTFIQTARELHNQLIPALSKDITHLIVVTDGRMSSIPFEVLLHQKNTPDTADYADMPYLINKYSISYSFAASLYVEGSKMSSNTTEKVLLFAPVSFHSDALPDLPGTKTEIERIDSLFASSGVAVQRFSESSATEELFSGDLTSYSILHLATHGMVDEENPEASCVFTYLPSRSEDDDNGKLLSGEIYNLKLRADLVTLSACQTGLGKITKGEGIVGLSRALFYAGAENLIVSLWKVSDQSTQLLTFDIYKYYLQKGTIRQNGYTYAEAMQSAKQELIRSATYCRPYYWAPFVVIGE